MHMRRICYNQIEEAKKYKWIKGEKLGYDPGDEAIHEWVREHAASYRERYKETYNQTIEKVKAEALERLNRILGEDATDEMKTALVRHICDVFTEVWVQEVAKDERNNPHLEEI